MGIFDGAIGDIFGAVGNIIGAKQSADASEWATRKQIEWEREKMQNAHQYEVKDLEKAGLNKVLSANGSGAQGGGINPPMPDYSGIGRASEQIGHMINTGLDVELKRAKAQSEIDKSYAETALLVDDMKPGRLKDQQVNKLIAERNLTEKMATTEDKKALNIAAKTAYQEVITKIKNKDLNWYEADKIINYILSIIPYYGLGKMMSGFGKGVVENASRETTNKIIKNGKWKKWNNQNYRYELRADGIVDRSTGEFIQGGWID